MEKSTQKSSSTQKQEHANQLAHLAVLSSSSATGDGGRNYKKDGPFADDADPTSRTIATTVVTLKMAKKKSLTFAQ